MNLHAAGGFTNAPATENSSLQRRLFESSFDEFARLGQCGRLRRFSIVFDLEAFTLSLHTIAAFTLAIAALPLTAQNSATAVDLAASAQKQLPGLTETYKHLHENPELSGHEVQTAAYVAEEWRKLGYTVTAHVGKYQDGTQAEGVVAIL